MKNSALERKLPEHKTSAEEIIKKMYRVLMRAERKIEDNAYRKALEKLPKE